MSLGAEKAGAAGGGSSPEDGSAMAEAVWFPSSEEELSAASGSEEGRPFPDSSCATPSTAEASTWSRGSEAEELSRETGKFASPVLSDLFSVERFAFFLE